MQTKLSDFLRSNTQADALVRTDSNTTSDNHLSSTCTGSVAYTESYPCLSSISRTVCVSLQLLDERAYSRHFVRSTFAPLSSPCSPFAREESPTVRQVTSASHASRTNEDGELLLSSVEVFKNCLTDIVWDPKDDFFIASRRSRFQLFDAASLLHQKENTENAASPLLDLKAATVQARLGAENRISFGLSTVRFLGNTLHTICGYSGAGKIDVFDLEDLDEESGEPVRTFTLDGSSLPLSEEQSIPTATAITSVSDTVAIAALSNGSSAFLDVRESKPVLCTRTANSLDIINTCGAQSNRARKRKCNTAVGVLHCGSSTQVITGTKSGLVELWDMRRCDQPVTSASVCGSVESLSCVSPSHSNRCGAPLVWLNTDMGDISCFSIGATSLEEVSCVKTKDNLRPHNSASLSAPKLSVMPGNDLLAYPFISSNAVLLYDTTLPYQNEMRRTSKRVKPDAMQTDELNVKTKAEGGDFRNAKTLLGEQRSRGGRCFSSLLESGSMQQSPTLLQSIAFHDWSYQISCVSAANRHDVIAVGGDDGDIHFLLDSFS